GGLANPRRRSGSRRRRPRPGAGGYVLAAVLLGDRPGCRARAGRGARRHHRPPRLALGYLQGLRGESVRACARMSRPGPAASSDTGSHGASAYGAAGVDYRTLDAGKRSALTEALATSGLLRGRGGRALDTSRGEPAFVFEAGG